MRKRKLFHATTSTRIIAGAVLLISLILLSLFPVSQYLIARFTEDVLLMADRLEEDLDLSVSFDHLSSDILQRISIEGIQINTGSSHQLIHIEALEINEPAYILIPRLLFTRSIPVEIRGLSVNVDTETEQLLLTSLERFPGATGRGGGSDPSMVLRATLSIQGSTITWNGTSYTGRADISWLSADIKDSRVTRLQSQIDTLAASGSGITGTATHIYASYQDTDGSAQVDLSVDEAHIDIPRYIREAGFNQVSVSYRMKDDTFSASLKDTAGNLTLSVGEGPSIPGTSVSASTLTVEGRGILTGGLQGSAETTDLVLDSEAMQVKAKRLSVTGSAEPLQLSFSAPFGFFLQTAQSETVQGGDSSFSILRSPDELRVYTFSDSIKISDALMTRLYPALEVQDVHLDNPSVYGRYVFSEKTSEWESDGDLSLDLISPIHTSLSALVFADARISHALPEAPLSIDSLTVHGKNIATDRIDDLLDATLTYSHRGTDQILSASLSQGNGLFLRYLRDSRDAVQSLYVNTQDLLLDEYRTVIEEFAPEILLYTSAQSALTGEFRGSFEPGFRTFDVNTSLALTGIRVADVTMNAAATLLLEATEDTLTIPSATVTTENLRAAFSGEIDRLTLFPRGTLEASNVSSGRSYATAVFSQSAQRAFGYTVNSSYLETFSAEGTLRRIGDDLISTAGDLTLFSQTRPYIASLYLDTRTLEGSMPRLQVRVKVDEDEASLSVSFNASGFILPKEVITGMNRPFQLDAQIEGSYSFIDAGYTVSSSSFSLSDLSFLNIEQGEIDLGFTLDPQSLDIDSLSWSDEYGTLTGSALYEVPERDELSMKRFRDSFLSLALSGEGESLELLLLPSEQEETNPFSVRMDAFNLRRLHPLSQDLFTTVSIYGTSDFSTVMEAEGNLLCEFAQDQSALSASLSVDSTGFTLYDGLYTRGPHSISEGILSYDTEGELSLGALFTSEKTHIYRDATSTSRVGASAVLPPAQNLFEGISDLVPMVRRDEIPDIMVSLRDTSLFNMLLIPDSDHILSLNDRILTVTKGTGGFLDLSYHLDTGEIAVSADESFLWPMEGKGTAFRDFISIDFSDIVFDFTHINALFIDPSIRFESGRLSGSVLIEGDPLDPGYYGMMYGTDLSLSLFWLPDTVLTVENPVVTLNGGTFTLPYTSTNARGKNRPPATGQFAMSAEFARWIPDSYVIDATIETGTIPLYIPITNIDMLIQGEARGSFSIEGTLKNETLRGDIIAPNASISFGIPQLPEWYIPRARTSGEFTFTSGRNVTFVYPNEDAPIVSATVQDGQKLSVSFTAPEMTYGFSGNVALRSGEIFYVQENFYITEGNISFNDSPPGTFEEVLPRVDLRARLRKYDEDRERIDIYLILQNSLLTEINPRFESIPTRTDNEILQLLGQNLLTSGNTAVSDAGFQSVLIAATAATDVITRFGLIQGNTISFGFSSVIREALGLDVFTIRSNLLQNILLDAIPGAIDNENASPFGRYLDNTTFYLGKYLADELYLQGLISMQRDPGGVQSSFLAPDLTLDTELSVEWLNPLATFSVFTQPTELSLFNIFDTMGFSVTKSIEF